MFARALHRLLATAMIVTVLALACSQTQAPSKQIVGKWQEANGSAVLTFYSGGEFARTSPGLLGTVTEQGTYKFLSDTDVRIDIPGLFTQSNIYAVAVSEDWMSLTPQGGRSTEYRRSD